MVNRESRRGFVHAGRLIAYIVVLLLAVGAFVAFKSYSHSVEENGGVELAAPARAELARYLADWHRSAATNPGSLTVSDAGKLSDSLAQWLGTRKTVEELFDD